MISRLRDCSSAKPSRSRYPARSMISIYMILYYFRVYSKERTYRDAGLYLRIKTLEWLNYSHLDILPINRVDEMW
jgi:hypothetical protein